MWGYPGFAGTPENDFDRDADCRMADKEPSWLSEHCVSASPAAVHRGVYQRKEEVVGAEMMRHFRKRRDAANARFPVERAPAAMDYLRQVLSSARLCAKISEVECCARILRYAFAAMLESLKYAAIKVPRAKSVHGRRKRSKRWKCSREEAERALSRCSS